MERRPNQQGSSRNLDFFRAVDPTKYYQQFLKINNRPDGRELKDFRSIGISVDTVSPADGSVVLRIGHTMVICAVKAELGSPRFDKPGEGYLVVNVELDPTCCPGIRPGPPNNETQNLTNAVPEIIKRSAYVDLPSLCIQPGKVVWVLYCNLMCMSYDGAVLDACMSSLVAALRCVRLPMAKYDASMGSFKIDKDVRFPLKLSPKAPFITEFAVFKEGRIASDPTREEEVNSLGKITVGVIDEAVLFVRRTDNTVIEQSVMKTCVQYAMLRAKCYSDLIETAVHMHDTE